MKVIVIEAIRNIGKAEPILVQRRVKKLLQLADRKFKKKKLKKKIKKRA